VPFLQASELAGSVAHFRDLFNDGSAYVITVPTYAFGMMALGWATDDKSLRQVQLSSLEERFKKANFTTNYYSPEVHKAAFALPMYVKRIID
jgi:spermidine synthase